MNYVPQKMSSFLNQLNTFSLTFSLNLHDLLSFVPLATQLNSYPPTNFCESERTRDHLAPPLVVEAGAMLAVCPKTFDRLEYPD